MGLLIRPDGTTEKVKPKNGRTLTSKRCTGSWELYRAGADALRSRHVHQRGRQAAGAAGQQEGHPSWPGSQLTVRRTNSSSVLVWRSLGVFNFPSHSRLRGKHGSFCCVLRRASPLLGAGVVQLVPMPGELPDIPVKQPRNLRQALVGSNPHLRCSDAPVHGDAVNPGTLTCSMLCERQRLPDGVQRKATRHRVPLAVGVGVRTPFL